MGPYVGEVHEVGDEGGAELLGDEVAGAVGEGLDGPGDDVLEEARRVILAQPGAVSELATNSLDGATRRQNSHLSRLSLMMRVRAA